MSYISLNGIKVPVAKQSRSNSVLRPGSRLYSGLESFGDNMTTEIISIETTPVSKELAHDFIQFSLGNFHTFPLDGSMYSYGGLRDYVTVPNVSTPFSAFFDTDLVTSNGHLTGVASVNGVVPFRIGSHSYTVLVKDGSGEAFVYRPTLESWPLTGLSVGRVDDILNLNFSSTAISELVILLWECTNDTIAGYMDLEERYGKSPLSLLGGYEFNDQGFDCDLRVNGDSKIYLNGDDMDTLSLELEYVKDGLFVG